MHTYKHICLDVCLISVYMHMKIHTSRNIDTCARAYIYIDSSVAKTNVIAPNAVYIYTNIFIYVFGMICSSFGF